MKGRFKILTAIPVLIVMLLLPCFLHAAVDNPIYQRLDGRLGQLLTGASVQTTDLVYENIITRNRIDLTKPQSYSNVISLYIDEKNPNYIPSDFACEITFNVSYKNTAGLVSTLDDQKLKVTYNKAEGVKFDARQYIHFAGGQNVTVTVTAINDFGATWDVKKFLILENKIEITRDYKFNVGTQEQVTGLVNNGSAATADDLEVSWAEDPLSGLTHYDIEWAWVDAEVADRYKTGGNFMTDLVFADNASRVTIKRKQECERPDCNPLPHYNIPMMYDGTGYLFYRVRPLQYLVSGRIVNGAWSSGSTITNYFSFAGHETDFNWQASTSYAEDGKRKTVVQYFDGTMRSRQTVTKDNTSNTTIIAETFYDYQGRPAIQVLPAPRLNSIIGYARDFNKFQPGGIANPYQKDLYDLVQSGSTACNAATPPLVTTGPSNEISGAGQYYSPNNPKVNEDENKFIPDAEGYAYAETRYSQDATGRIAAQSGVGAAHTLGSNKETKYFYGSAKQKELDALFGPEVGEASHYFKNMVRDANGQYSVSYVDMNGKTIATALAGKNPDALDPLASYTAVANANNITESLLTPQNNIVHEADKNIVYSGTLLVPQRGTYTFNYELTPESLEIAACNPAGERVCYDCLYDLEIRISDNCGSFTKVITRTNFNLSALDVSCDNPAPSIVVLNEDAILEEGEYNVTKTLSLNQTAQSRYKNEVYKIKNVCKTLLQFYNETLETITTQSNCHPTCEQCNAALGTKEAYKARFLTAMGLTQSTPDLDLEIDASWNQNKAICGELCTDPGSKLQGIKMMMLEQMSPRMGQFADAEHPDKPFSIYNYSSFFQHTPYLYPAKQETPPILTPDFFRTGTGQPDNTAYAAGPDYNMFSYNTPDQFNGVFRDSWAEALLRYHPEYPKYEKASTVLAASYQFDELLESAETFISANTAANDYINNILNKDPFFNGPGLAYKESMRQYMEESYRHIVKPDGSFIDYSLWQIAWMSIHCMTFGNNMDESCALSAPKKPPFALNDCNGDWNTVWSTFRTMYISAKTEFTEAYLNTGLPSITTDFYNTLSTTHYQRVFGTAQELNSGAVINGQGIPASASTITQAYDDNCESYRLTWINEIMECDQVASRPENIRTALLTALTNALKDVCVRGSDLQHVMGSASEIPGDPRDYDNFEQAITAVFSTYGISTSALCHPYLISYPALYDHQAPVSDDIVIMQHDPCVCEKITAIKLRKQTDGFTGTLSSYIQYQYGVTVSQATLDVLQNGCSGDPACVSYDPPVAIPGFLGCNGTAAETCITCDEYTAYVTAFHVKFPALTAAPYETPVTETEFAANHTFEQFMNYNTGFNKTWSDYIRFGKACATYNTQYSCTYLQSIVTDFHTLHPDLTGEDCRLLFVQYFNQVTGQFYTWQDIQNLYLNSCGHLPDVCNPVIKCTTFTLLMSSFHTWYNTLPMPKPSCEDAFVTYFNAQMGTAYTWQELVDIHTQVCHTDLDVCSQFPCSAVTEMVNAYIATNPWQYTDCFDRMTVFFNTYFGTNLSADKIQIILSGCLDKVNYCGPPVSCQTMEMYITAYNTHPPACASAFAPGTNEYCRDCFTKYISGLLHYEYTYPQIQLIYTAACGGTLAVCEGNFTCSQLSSFMSDYLALEVSPGLLTCEEHFTAAFNLHFSTTYTFNEIKGLFILYCGYPPAVCNSLSGKPSLDEANGIYDNFKRLYPNPAGYFTDCELGFQNYYNMVNGTSLNYEEIKKIYMDVTGAEPNVCDSEDCAGLHTIYNSYITRFGAYAYPRALRRDLLIKLYRDHYALTGTYTWEDVERIFARCGIVPPFPADAGTLLTCAKVNGFKKAFYEFYPGALPDNCDQVFAGFFNLYYNVQMDSKDILAWAAENCNMDISVCSSEGVGEGTGTGSGGGVIINPPPPPAAIPAMPPRLCGLNTPQYPTVNIPEEDPCDFNITLATNASAELYNVYVQTQLNNFDIAYQAKCLAAKSLEHFTVTYKPAEYHYTLYYYDQAGNLVKTVPPAGVNPNYNAGYLASVNDYRTGATGTMPAPPAHTLITEYKYNTLGQVVIQKSPDAGTSRYWYDVLGRIVLSQNAKQQPQNKYSYTEYDLLGRIQEVGEKQISGTVDQELSQDPSSLAAALTGTRTEITHTVYDEPYEPYCDPGSSNNILCQANMRNRVSYTYVKASTANTDIPWDAATFYSYDIHGNVSTLLQDYYSGAMRAANNRFKKIEYNYDLISGKVNEVAYQPGAVDAFYHRYDYDAENRLRKVETSRDRIYWETDARYKYYKHGPLARMVLGENMVQGVDYAYTIQGWLKGINSTSVRAGADAGWGSGGVLGSGADCGPNSGVDNLAVNARLTPLTPLYTAHNSISFNPGFESAANDVFEAVINTSLTSCGTDGTAGTSTGGSGNFSYDMGQDGAAGGTHALVAGDAYGFSLNYFAGDYKAINATVKPFVNTNVTNLTNTDNNIAAPPLYNGNIACMLVNIPKLGDAQLYAYKYDQLNRIKSMDVFRGFNNAGNTWSSVPVASADYKERISYDWNGNILTYNRNGNSVRTLMDQMTYNYKPGTNQLDKITDAATDASISDYDKYNDIKQGQGNGNYQFDAIGNLISDASENISNIEWTAYGKIKRVTKSGSSIEYSYDASGNRISKIVSDKTTWYVRDAGGKIMSTYESGGINNGDLTQRELHLYGSNRIGIYNVNTNVKTLTIDNEKATLERANKYLELNNHLGNVLSVITDKVAQHSANNISVDYFDADIISANEYYSFGMPMPGRKFNSIKYRFGFNGKENNNEINGDGNQQDYGMRIYDSRTGKFLSIDPLTKTYPELTPYQFASNSPIQAIDLDGLEGIQYLQVINVKGVPVIKRVVEVNVYVAISRVKDTKHYYSKNVSGDEQVRNNVQNDLNSEYKDNKFKDLQGHDVIWKYNVSTFEVTDESIDTKHRELLSDNTFKVQSKNGSNQYRGVIIQQAHLSDQTIPDQPTDLPVAENGELSRGFDIAVNNEYYDERQQRSHTMGHEMNHFLLRLHPDVLVRQPAATPEAHRNAGGGNLTYGTAEIRYPGTLRVNNEKPAVTIKDIKPLNQNNVNNILQSVPKVGIETVNFSLLLIN